MVADCWKHTWHGAHFFKLCQLCIKQQKWGDCNKSSSKMHWLEQHVRWTIVSFQFASLLYFSVMASLYISEMDLVLFTLCGVDSRGAVDGLSWSNTTYSLALCCAIFLCSLDDEIDGKLFSKSVSNISSAFCLQQNIFFNLNCLKKEWGIWYMQKK